MKILKHKKIILIVIITLAFVLRFWHLNSYPALNADEASIGYDAYSLIQTAHDQHGNAWPIDFQSFNDYKPGLYVYLVLPFVKVLGLTELAVRAPNALISVITVYVIYLLVKELFGKDKEDLALLSALFIAISPWHIQFSRGGWEVNVATFLITTGVLFFVKALKNKFRIWNLIIGILCFVASMYCYQATRVVSPLIGLGLTAIYRKEIFTNLRKFITAGIIGFIFLVPLLLDFTHGGVLNRAAGVGLFADSGPRSRVEEQRGEHGLGNNSIFTKAIHNKIVNYTLAFLDNWGSHFHGEFLFLSGDNVTRNKVPETGQMYLIDILFLAVGFITILRSKIKKEIQILLMWIVFGPVASALTFQAPSALRAENIVIPLVMISALGSVKILEQISINKIKILRITCFLIFGLLIIWNFLRYEQMYWVHMSKEYQYSSQYGVKELVNYIKSNQNKYKKILVTDRFDQPYILFLFYMKYPPAKFQVDHSLTQKDQFGLSTVNHFDKYYFASIKFDQAKTENPNTLIIGTDKEIPKEANIIKDIYGSNNFLYFRIVAN